MKAAGRGAAERSTAFATAVFGAVVSAESLTHDIGWNETGPGPGYFPFRVGLLLVLASVALWLQNRRADPSAAFVSGLELRRSLSVFWPTATLVAGMFALGCYVPSAVYLAWMMRRHGGYGWFASAAGGVAVMAAFFLVFDVWFRVPLAKGPIEAALGLY